MRVFRTYACFELHHINPAKKSPDYDNLIRRKLSDEQLDELDKCALLCGNCHDTLHGQNITVPVEISLNVEGVEPVLHVITCSIIYDYEKNEATLFSDEFKLLDVYKVQIGTGVVVMSGLQLEPVLNEFIERTKTDGSLVVSTLNGQILCRADRVNDHDVRVKYNLDFPLITAKLDFASAGGDMMELFLRPGNIVVDTGVQYVGRTYGRVTMEVVSHYNAT